MKEIINKVSKDLRIPKEVVSGIYKLYWKFIRETISNLPLEEDLTDEEFNKFKTSFNLPHIGKFGVNINHWKKTKKRIAYVKHKKSKTKI